MDKPEDDVKIKGIGTDGSINMKLYMPSIAPVITLPVSMPSDTALEEFKKNVEIKIRESLGVPPASIEGIFKFNK